MCHTTPSSSTVAARRSRSSTTTAPSQRSSHRCTVRLYCKRSTPTRIRPIRNSHNRKMALICWRHRSKVEWDNISALCSARLLAVLLVQAHVGGGLWHGQRPGLRSAGTARKVDIRRSSQVESRCIENRGVVYKHHVCMPVDRGFKTRYTPCTLNLKILSRSEVQLLDLSAIAPMH